MFVNWQWGQRGLRAKTAITLERSEVNPKGGFPLTYFYKTREKIAREHTFDDEIIIHQIKLFIKSHSARTAEES